MRSKDSNTHCKELQKEGLVSIRISSLSIVSEYLKVIQRSRTTQRNGLIGI